MIRSWIALTAVIAAAFAQQQLMFDWISIDFTWTSPERRQAAINNGDYKPEKVIISGIKLYDDKIYLSSPRLEAGVPSTMNRINKNPQFRSPLLEPYPSWDANRIGGNCGGLQNVLGMEINPRTGRMWALDIGQINILDTVNGPINTCPSKLVIINLNDGSVFLSFVFPDNVVARGLSFLNDLAIDPVRSVAYITNTMERTLVIFDLKQRTARKVHHQSMNPNPFASTFEINGNPFTANNGIDGIALSPDYSQVYYCSINGFALFSIPADVLLNPDVSEALFDQKYKVVYNKSFQSDGMVWGKQNLYYGSLPGSAVYRKQPNAVQVLIAQNSETLQWPDAFAIDQLGYLWLTSRKELEKDFSGMKGPNFFVSRISIGERSYLDSSASIRACSFMTMLLLVAMALCHMGNAQ